jgi:assimilatory nitrate reductase catalytic subunit
VTASIRTTCPYCGVGCGVLARPDGAGTAITGDPAHPSNAGRLCSKGAALGATLGATLGDAGRLLRPRVDGQEAGWDEALDLVARRFRETAAEHGPDSVAFYVSGQFLTEDYYAANKLMKGFIGSGNIDTNSRLCMASSVAGHVRTFGEDVVPGVYEDWEAADLVVLVGSNAVWCHPVLHQRLQAARAARGTQVVVLDPRRTATAEAADLYLPIASGTDVVLFQGLLTYLDDAGALDHAWTARHTAGLDDALAVARRDAPSPDAVAEACGVDREAVETFYALFARTERVLTAYSQGVNQSSAGTDKVNAVVNCHLATGRIGRPGMGPFSLTGQPNAMGGREVGGLANQLAAHMRWGDPGEVEALRGFWDAPNLATGPGLKAVELFDAVLDGRVKAVWIAATNPAASLPRTDRVRAALAACPFVVVSDAWETDTTGFASVLLPAASWGEKSGTVTSSERRISRQRPFRAAPGEARPDWWMFAEVGRRMGWADAFAWVRPSDVFREHAALSGIANGGRRLFDISALAVLGEAAYDAMEPVRWPCPAGGAAEGGRLFAQGGFPTADGRARIVPTPYRGRPDQGGMPFLLNTGRVRDQWHTMTRTGAVPALMAHTPEPLLAINPADAARIGLGAGNLARVETAEGAVVLRADLTHAQRRGEVFAPMHWTDQFAQSGPVARAVGARLDPHSGQPELKATPARVSAVDAAWHGLLLRRRGARLPDVCHWVRLPVDAGQVYRLAGLRALPRGADLAHLADLLLDAPAGAERLEATDPARGVLRVAVVADGRLDACLFTARDSATLPAPEALLPMLGEIVPDAGRCALLAGRPRTDMVEDGPRVCACFGVGLNAIRHAAVTHRLRTVAELGDAVRAGTGCGSCVPELERILRDVRAPAG